MSIIKIRNKLMVINLVPYISVAHFQDGGELHDYKKEA